MFTLTGTLKDHAGKPVADSAVVIIPSPSMTKDESGNVVYLGGTTVYTDSEGDFTASLVADEDNIVYTVRSAYGGPLDEPIHFNSPADGTTVNLADVTPVEAPDKYESYLSGASAYEVAVKNGFSGTETEWLSSLRGGVTDSVATFDDLPGNPGDGQTFIVRDEVALYTWDGSTWAGPVPVQGAATDTAVTSLVTATGTALRKALDDRDRGANVARFIRRAQAGGALKVSIVGDSTADKNTPGNAQGGPAEKLATVLATRFTPATFTVTNRARSGATILSSYLDGDMAAAIGDDADLYIIMFGRNDSLAEVVGGSVPVPGAYTRAASIAALERFCALIRERVDKADILIVGQSPSLATAANPALLAWQEEARQVAAVWGAEWYDGYKAFTDYGDYSTLMLDSDHQNAAGNDYYAQTLARHFPAAYIGPSAPASIPSTRGLTNVSAVNKNLGQFGYLAKATPGTSTVTYTTGGTGWSGETTTTPGDYVEVSCADCIELHIDINTAIPVVVDIAVDGVTTATDVNLATIGKSGIVWMAATGLTRGTHTFRLTLKSGTLDTYTVAALMAAASTYQPTTLTVNLTPESQTSKTLGSAYIDLISGVSVPLPAGWASMDVQAAGWAQFRSTSATSKRTINYALRDTGADVDGTRVLDILPTTGGAFVPAPIVGTLRGVTTTRAISVRARVTGTDLDLTTCTGVYLTLTLTRTA